MSTVRSADLGYEEHGGHSRWGTDFHVEDELLQQFVEALKDWSRGQAGPVETDVDLLDVVPLLPLLFWFDLKPDGAWVGRFIGAEIVGVRGSDPTQEALADAETNVVDGFVRAFFNLVVKAGETVASTGRSVVEDKNYLTTESVAAPVFDAEGKVCGVIGAQVFYRPDGQRVGTPS